MPIAPISKWTRLWLVLSALWVMLVLWLLMLGLRIMDSVVETFVLVGVFPLVAAWGLAWVVSGFNNKP